MRALLSSALIAGVLLAPASAEAAARRAPTLEAFPSCSALLRDGRDLAQAPPIPFRGPMLWSSTDRITPRTPFDKPDPTRAIPPVVGVGTPEVSVAARAPAPAAAIAGSGSGADVATSTTNVQETGIDEPDLVKAVAGRLYVVAGTKLWALDGTGDTPRVLGSLDLEGAGGTLLVEGDRALLLTPREPFVEATIDVAVSPASGPVATTARAARRAQAARAAAATRLTELDIADPAKMRILRRMDVPGDLVTARLTDGTARIVINSAAALVHGDAGASAMTTPAQGISRRAARRLKLADFIPRTVLRSRVTGKTYARRLVQCGEVREPEDPAGTDLLTVLTVDLRKGLFNLDRDAVLGSAQVVYASPTGLYVGSAPAATVPSGTTPPDEPMTDLFRFDTTRRGETTFAASGTVAGFALNQYALSESDGVLRIATTRAPFWSPDPGARRDTESVVTTFRQQGDRLAQLGQVGGLGKTERIYAARFIGDRAYLVTFRQVDPLYAIDLSDPAKPTVAGELKISGYSAYLHPVGDDLLLGVGREATSTGRATGSAASLFDVADPKAPKLLARRDLDAGGQSGTEFDPHAFLWWAPAKLALIPSTAPGDWQRSATGMVGSLYGLRADRATGLTPAGRALHGPDWDRPEIKRSVVVGDRVLTLSDLGIQAAGLGDLAPQGWLPWLR